MIRNVVFDMGQVLIRFDGRYFIRRQGIPEADQELVWNQVFRSLEWMQMDRGSKTEEEAVAAILPRIPQRLQEAVRLLVTRWDEPLVPIPGMYELIQELKENGYGIYLLSNASRRQHEYWPRVPASRFFDGTLISADVHLMKPQPEIYRLLCDRFSLKAPECFFVDDSPANIEAALCCDMPGAIFHGDVAELRTQMRSAGIRVASAQIGSPAGV